MDALAALDGPRLRLKGSTVVGRRGGQRDARGREGHGNRGSQARRRGGHLQRRRAGPRAAHRIATMKTLDHSQCELVQGGSWVPPQVCNPWILYVVAPPSCDDPWGPWF